MTLRQTITVTSGGLYEPDKHQLQEWREILDPTQGNDIIQFLNRASQDDFEITQDGALKTTPQGWPKDHPDIEYLRLKHIAVFKKFPRDAWMLTAESFDIILEGFEFLHKWHTLLNRLIQSDATK